MITFNSENSVSKKQIFLLRESIKDILKYLGKLKKEMNIKNPYKLKKAFYSKMNQTLNALIENNNILVSAMKINALENLVKNFEEIDKIYNQIIKEEKYEKKCSLDELAYISTNAQQNKINVVKECLIALRNDLDAINNFPDKKFLPRLARKKKRERDKILDDIEKSKMLEGINQKLGQDIRKNIRQEIERKIKIFRTPEIELLKNAMNRILIDWRQKFREKYQSSLIFIGNFLKEFDLIKHYTNTNNENLQKIGLEEIKYTEEEIESLFTQEYLSKLSMEELTYLNVFWINKFAKEMENICKSSFIITDFDLWKDIFDEKYIKFSQEDLQWELLKIETLTDFSIECIQFDEENEILKKAIEKIQNDENAKRQATRNLTIKLDITEHIHEIESKYGSKYNTRYSKKLLKSKNNLRHEIDYFKSIYNIIEAAYKLKDVSLIGILNNLQLNDNIKNWGIMSQVEETHLLDRKNWLIGIDLVGMNMPIRLHIPKDLAIDSICKNGEDKIVPLYMGGEDYKSNSSWLTSPILIPITDEKKKILKEKMNENTSEMREKLYSHLAYIYGITDIPNHLKTDESKSKKGKKSEKRVFVKKYINVETGEISDDISKIKTNKGDDER